MGHWTHCLCRRDWRERGWVHALITFDFAAGPNILLIRCSTRDRPCQSRFRHPLTRPMSFCRRLLPLNHNGDVLILDSSRDQILRLTPSGKLSVFAGSGRQGFSGDGGPAVNAELNFQYFSAAGMAVAPNGTTYFVDDGNCRLRAINTKGIIRTVTRLPLIPLHPGTGCTLGSLAVSSSGTVYVATSSDIEKVTPRGTLAWVAGSSRGSIDEPKNLTASNTVMSPGSITFNAEGDLDIWSWEPRVVFQLSPSGKITDLGARVCDATDDSS